MIRTAQFGPNAGRTIHKKGTPRTYKKGCKSVCHCTVLAQFGSNDCNPGQIWLSASVRFMPNRQQILIISNNAREAARYVAAVIHGGYRSRHVSSADEAINESLNWEPNLILLGSGLTDMASEELCHKIKSHGKTRDVPLILISSSTGAYIVTGEAQSLANEIITATATDEYLLKRIHLHIEGPGDPTKEASASPEETSRYLTNLFDASLNGVAFLDPEGRFIRANTTFRQLLGFGSVELSKTSLPELAHKSDQAKLGECLKALKEGTSRRFEDEIMLSTTHDRFLSCRIRLEPAGVDEASISPVLAQFQPLHQGSRPAEDLASQKDFLNSILDSIPDGVAVFDDNGKLFLHNTSAEKILGPGLHSSDKKDWPIGFGLYFPDMSTPYNPDQLPMARAIRGDSVDSAEIGVRLTEVTDPRLISMSARPLHDSANLLMGGVVVFHDITEQKHSDEALEIQSQVLLNMTEGVSISDKYGFMRYTNPALEKMLGYGRGELNNQHLSILNTYTGEENAKLAKEINNALKEEGFWIGEMSNRHKEGRILSAHARISLLEVSGAKYWVCVQEDVTERKRTEEALRESEERFARIYRSSPASIIITTLREGRIIDMNDACLDWLGYSRNEVIGRTSRELSFWARPEDEFIVVEELQKANVLNDLEKGFRTRRGEVREALINADLIELSGEECVIWIANDITERIKTAESIKKSLKEKEILLQEIHHRVKNNLQVISSLLNLQSNYIKDAASKELFRESQDRVKSMALIHEKLYQSKDLARIDFSEYIESLMTMLLQSYRSGGNIKLDANITDTHLDIDTAIPVGLMLNELVSNSLKHAFPKGRDGTISVTLTPQAEKKYCLVVSDDGVGIPEGVNIETSNSLGLRLVRILTRQIGGDMSYSSDGQTQFTINFEDQEREIPID